MRERRRKEEILAANRGERRERERDAMASRAGRPGYCIVFSFGTNDLPRFPLYIAASYSPAKTRKGLQESPKATTTTDGGFDGGGGARRRENRERGNRAARYGRYYIFMGFWSRHGSKFQANLGRK